MQYKVVKSFTPDDSWEHPKGFGKFKSHYLDLDDGRRITLNTKVKDDGTTKMFEVGKSYDFEVSNEFNKSGKFLKAKHITVHPVTCPECGHEFIPARGETPKPPVKEEPPVDDIPF